MYSQPFRVWQCKAFRRHIYILALTLGGLRFRGGQVTDRVGSSAPAGKGVYRHFDVVTRPPSSTRPRRQEM